MPPTAETNRKNDGNIPNGILKSRMPEEEGKYPTKLEIPGRLLHPADLTQIYEKVRQDFIIDATPDGAPINLSGGRTTTKDFRNAEYYVDFKDGLPTNGTYMKFNEMSSLISPIGLSMDDARKLVFGKSDAQDTPLVSFESNDPKHVCKINIFAGATNNDAYVMAKIGTQNEFPEPARRIYQKSVVNLFAPIAKRPIGETRKNLGITDHDLIWHDVEDCAASFAHLGGVGLVLEYLRKNRDLPFKARRIDVTAATLQSLTLLIREAQRQNIPTEINLSLTAVGLTLGINKDLEHRNYVTFGPKADYPEFGQFIDEGLLMALGDMGEAGKYVGVEPWGSYRPEAENLISDKQVAYTRYLDENDAELIVAYARGGYFMEGIARMIQTDTHIFRPIPTIMCEGKRIPIYYPDNSVKQGLMLRHIYQPLTKFIGRNTIGG
jgi:hypothetical protein